MTTKTEVYPTSLINLRACLQKIYGPLCRTPIEVADESQIAWLRLVPKFTDTSITTDTRLLGTMAVPR